MAVTARQLSILKEKIERQEKRVEQGKGRRKQILSQLAKLGCKSKKEARIKIKSLRNKRKDVENLMEKKIDGFRQTYDI